MPGNRDPQEILSLYHPQTHTRFHQSPTLSSTFSCFRMRKYFISDFLAENGKLDEIPVMNKLGLIVRWSQVSLEDRWWFFWYFVFFLENPTYLESTFGPSIHHLSFSTIQIYHEDFDLPIYGTFVKLVPAQASASHNWSRDSHHTGPEYAQVIGEVLKPLAVRCYEFIIGLARL